MPLTRARVTSTLIKQPRPSHEKNDGTIVGVGIAEVEDEDVAVNVKLEGAAADEELCG
jgi:hypothetical protein